MIVDVGVNGDVGDVKGDVGDVNGATPYGARCGTNERSAARSDRGASPPSGDRGFVLVALDA